MKKVFPAIFLAAALAALAAMAESAPAAPAATAVAAPAAPATATAPAEDPEATRTVEATAAIANGDRAAAKKSALAQARRAALQEYLELQVPPGVLKTKSVEVGKILGDAERLVAETQEAGSHEESGKLIVNFKIRLRPAEVKSRLAAAGLLPAGPLPEVFVMVRGVGLGDDFRSGWEANPPESGENECEAALAAELTRYGFTITAPKSGQADTARILSPGNEAERAGVFRYIKDKFGSEVMMVGVVTAEDEAKPRLKLRLAAADTVKEKLLWSGSRERIAPDSEPRSRVEALSALCHAAGEEAVQALYQSRLPALTPGAERELILTVQGIDRWPAVKELEKKLRTELPGVISLSLSRMEPGVVEYKLRTALTSKSLADWLAANQFGGMTMKVEEMGDYQITLQAKPPDPNAPPPPAPGTKPGTPAPKPGAAPTRPGATAPGGTRPATPATAPRPKPATPPAVRPTPTPNRPTPAPK